MNGVLLINKSIGITSHDVISKLRRKFMIKRIGHAGTLDPFASGVLIIGIGSGSKCLQFLESLDKEYIGTIKLGIKTDTGDLTGEVIEASQVGSLSNEQINDVLLSFVGKQEQVPPMYSALKVKGKKLYEYARQGIEIERKARTITIHSISLIGYNKDDQTLTYKVECSKGTYVRTLSEDIAKKLNTVGHLTSLTRTSIGNFKIEDSYRLEDDLFDKVLTIKQALSHLKQFKITHEGLLAMVRNGRKVSLNIDSNLVLLLDMNDEPIAVYKKDEMNFYSSLRGF